MTLTGSYIIERITFLDHLLFPLLAPELNIEKKNQPNRYHHGLATIDHLFVRLQDGHADLQMLKTSHLIRCETEGIKRKLENEIQKNNFHLKIELN